MSYRIAMASLTAAIVVIACVSTEAFAIRGGGRGGVHAGGVRAGGVHAGGVRAGGAYRGGAYRGGAAYRGAYVRRGVGVGVGAAAVGAAVAAPYYGGAQCGYPPYPPATSTTESNPCAVLTQ